MGNCFECFGKKVAPEVPARDYVVTEDVVWEPFTEYTIYKMTIEKSITDSRWYRVRLLVINEEGECTCYFIDYGVISSYVKIRTTVMYPK